jgi:hypothetical protein
VSITAVLFQPEFLECSLSDFTKIYAAVLKLYVRANGPTNTAKQIGIFLQLLVAAVPQNVMLGQLNHMQVTLQQCKTGPIEIN